jgi:hypothetical protein
VANRINGTESLTRKGFNCLLQQNLPKADIASALSNVRPRRAENSNCSYH